MASTFSSSPCILKSLLLLLLFLATSTQANSNIFRAYIGSQFSNIKFSDVPINPNVQFHFILAFAIDYTSSSSSSSSSSSPSPTNGRFNIFWDAAANLSPSQVSSIKNKHPNVRVSLALGGATVGNASVFFKPSSIDSWVSNAVSSLTRIIEDYHLCGIDIDYEQFEADPNVFAECIGRLIKTLKRNGVISFASIAPFDNRQVQSHYLALWRRYGDLIDFVNFQFYAYDRRTTISQFLTYFESQSLNYKGGKVLVSYISDGSGGLSPENNFFTACQRLKSQNKLYGIFVWCADDSKRNGFRYESRSQQLLAG